MRHEAGRMRVMILSIYTSSLWFPQKRFVHYFVANLRCARKRNQKFILSWLPSGKLT